MSLGGICLEHDWIPLKIRLSSGNQFLFIWMLEPDLKLLEVDEKSFSVKSVLKVMFKEENNPGSKEAMEPAVDQEVEIPLSVLKAGLETLQMSMEWSPPSHRQDSDLSIGYIDLSPVLKQ